MTEYLFLKVQELCVVIEEEYICFCEGEMLKRQMCDQSWISLVFWLAVLGKRSAKQKDVDQD